MADNEAPAKAANTVPANPVAIVWPQSENGFTTLMRREGTRAAGRIGTSEDKLTQFINELKILAGHAKSRHKQAVVALEVKQVKRAAERKAAAERAENDRLFKIEKMRLDAQALLDGADALAAGEADE